MASWKSYKSSGIAKNVKSLFEPLKLMAYSNPLPIETDRIHVANGTYFLNGTFRENKTYCNNHMSVGDNPVIAHQGKIRQQPRY